MVRLWQKIAAAAAVVAAAVVAAAVLGTGKGELVLQVTGLWHFHQLMDQTKRKKAALAVMAEQWQTRLPRLQRYQTLT